MTPELPRAPMSDPWAIALHTAAMSDPTVGARRSGPSLELDQPHSAQVRAMLVPVSPSGTGIDVQGVDGVLVVAQAVAKAGHRRRQVSRPERPQRLHGRGC